MNETKNIKIDRKADDIIAIHIKKSVFKYISIAIGFFVIMAVALTAYGLVKTVEMVNLKHTIQLQEDQLKLLDSKTKNLEKKMKEVNALDQELRQIISGTNRGALPQGGGTTLDLHNQSKAVFTGHKPSDLLGRLYLLDSEARRHIISFYTLKSILNAGGSEKIAQLQKYLVPINGQKDTHMPSLWPAQGIMTSRFGTRVDPITGRKSYHQGVDIANSYGTPIVATANGVVTKSDYVQGGYGLVVEIDNGNGFTTRFGHNSSALVHVGEKVKKGQAIALMGSTGRSTGTHVHYEVLINGANVDPMLFLTSSH